MAHVPVRAAELLLVFVKAFKTTLEWVKSSNSACCDAELHLQMGRTAGRDGTDDHFAQIGGNPGQEISKERVPERDLPARPQH